MKFFFDSNDNKLEKQGDKSTLRFIKLLEGGIL